MTEPPLFPGSILGLRTWAVRVVRNGDLRLCASFGDSLWEAKGRWTQARCLSGHHSRGDPVPSPGCSCGLYSLHPHLEQALEHQALYWGETEAQTPEDELSLELGEISGLVEAVGRIEVHETGFRAERARPVALIVGQSWSTFRRRGIERVARLHRAELLEVDGAQDLVDYCERRGGVLDQAALATLLEPPQTDGPDVVDLGRSTWTPPSMPPPAGQPDGRSRLQRIGEAAMIGLFWAFAAIWYAFWAAVVIFIAGAILFGWGDEKQWKAPARVERVLADRSKCRVDAVVRTTRSLNQLRLGIVAISHSGKNLGRATTVIHDVAKGTSRVKVREMRPWLCERPGPFLVRVRAVFGPLRAGHVAQVVSEPISGVRSAGASPTKSRS